MRYFWIIVGLFAAAGFAYVVIPPSAPGESPKQVPTPAVAPAPAVTPPAATPVAEATLPQASKPPAPINQGGLTDDELPSANAGPLTTPHAGHTPQANTAPVATPANPAPATAPTTAPTVPSAAAATFDILPAETKVRQDDGSLLIDGKWKITGEGTKEKPYVITWEMLTTAEHTFDPRAGSRKIPEGVAMLDGKWVKITGYVAFPLLVQEPRELLAMLNQWDGCCIGVPPSPYDAIEVRLKDIVTGDARFATFGHVTGRFGVQPYISGDWLIGLYIMDEGTLEIEAFGGFGGE